MSCTRGIRERKPKNACEELQDLCYGSPCLRYVLYLAYTIVLADPAEAEKRKSFRKLLLMEAVPTNAWYTADIVLRAAGFHSVVLSSELKAEERSELCARFNDPDSSISILPIMYDVQALGLNLHEACNFAFTTTIARNMASEIQAAARISRPSEGDATFP